jgi:hypothetical protein
MMERAKWDETERRSSDMTTTSDEAADNFDDSLDPRSLERHDPNDFPDLVGLPTSDWLDRARPLVEQAVNTLVAEFVEHPYLHRVEHSLHVRLFELLAENPLFSHSLEIGKTGWTTNPIHKEWPETYPRPFKDGRRGNFDLAILSKEQLANATVEQFRNGRIAAGVVIEIGLDYQLVHLKQDYEKLINSEVPAGYLVDLSRSRTEKLEVKAWILRVPQPEIRDWINEVPENRRPPGIAYVHHSTISPSLIPGQIRGAAVASRYDRATCYYKMIESPRFIKTESGASDAVGKGVAGLRRAQ